MRAAGMQANVRAVSSALTTRITYEASRRPRATMAFSTGLVILVGMALLMGGHASTPAISLEPESGTLSSGATTGSDTAASNGQYVQFGAAPGTGTTFLSNLITDPKLVVGMETLPKPAYMQPLTDAVFHTKLTRIAGDSGAPISFSAGGSGTWGADARQHYSTDQPWNSDGSLIALQNSGLPSVVYLDGNTYQPKMGKCSNYSLGDDWWNPSKTYPHVRVNISGSTLQWFDVTTCTLQRSWSIPFTMQEGVTEDQSWDGRYTAVTDGTSLVIVDMDPQAPLASYASGNKRVGPKNDVISNCGIASCSIDWVGVSPSGKYAFVSYTGEYERVFDINPDLTITPHAEATATFPGCHGTAANGYIYDLGHADMGVNPFRNNEDVLVGQEHCGNHGKTISGVTFGYVVMASLADGKATSLTTPANEAYPHHVSTLDYERPGWVVASFYPQSGYRYNNEEVFIKMDGSETVQRLIQSHTDSGSCYRCEAHGVPSRDGTRILFASSWSDSCGTGCGTTSNPQAYIVDARASSMAAAGAGRPAGLSAVRTLAAVWTRLGRGLAATWRTTLRAGHGLAVFFTAPFSPQTVYAAGDDEIHYTIISPTAVTFDWRGSLNTISYGTTTAYGSTATAVTPAIVPISSSGPFWEAKLTNLQPGTVYHYSVGGGSDHTFQTAPTAAGSFTAAAEGDIGDSLSYSNMPLVQNLVKSLQTNFVLAVGDLAYGDHGASHNDQHFNDVMVWSQDEAYMPAWGNADWDHPEVTGNDFREFKGRFDLPNAQASPSNTSYPYTGGGEDWGWFDYGGVRFISYPDPWSGSVFSDWYAKARTVMDDAQANSAIKWIVTYGHRPAYSSGHHSGDTTLQGYLDALGDAHSKYVLNVNGHSHGYERTYPQHGVTHITAGTGGASLEEDGTCLWLICTEPSWSAKRFMHQGALKISFSPTSIQLAYYCGPAGGGTNDITCTSGQVIDSATIGTPSVTDTQAPAVSITSPAAGSTISGTATVSVSASDNVGVSKVELYADSTLQSAGAAAPYTFSLDTTKLSNGTHSLVAKAYDAAGNVGTSAAVSVTVQQPVSCAVANPPTTYGEVTQTASIPQTGSYRLWSRLMAPDTTNNSYYIQIDGGCPINVGDSTSIAAGTWTWLNYRDGSAASPIDLSLTAGSHTIVYIGRETGVRLDRVLLLGDTTCLPTGTGDNCANIDITPPSVSMTAPAAGATVSGTAMVTASASDASGIKQVDFYLDAAATPFKTLSTAPYSFGWDSTTAANGSHSVKAKATDNAGNTATSTAVSFTVGNSTTTALPGDANGDGRVNALDLSILISHDGQNYPPADFNGDGTVGSADLAVLLGHWTW